MKLFLTSHGLSNPSLKGTFRGLLGKDPQQIKVAFVPTAANVLPGTPWWPKEVENIRSTGISAVDIVDLDKLSAGESIRRCAAADVIWLNGGNTYYLLEHVRKSGLARELSTLLRDRLYVGASAGSMIVGPSIEANAPFFPEEENYRIADLTGLGVVSFAIIPHLDSPMLPNINQGRVEAFSRTVRYPLYALDDMSAIVLDNEKIGIVSEGKTLSYNNLRPAETKPCERSEST